MYSNKGFAVLIFMTVFVYIHCQLHINIEQFDVPCGANTNCKFPARFCNRKEYCEYCGNYCNNEPKDIPPGCHLACYVKNEIVIPQKEFNERCRQTNTTVRIPEKAQDDKSSDNKYSLSTFIYGVLILGILEFIIFLTFKLWKYSRSKRKTPRQNSDTEDTEDKELIKQDEAYLNTINEGKTTCTKDGKYVTTPQNDRETTESV